MKTAWCITRPGPSTDLAVLFAPQVARLRGARLINSAKPGRRLALSFWRSLYFTAPLFLLDWLYCGIYLGEGAGYFAKYWYLTVFYFVPWMLFLPMGVVLEKKRATT